MLYRDHIAFTYATIGDTAQALRIRQEVLAGLSPDGSLSSQTEPLHTGASTTPFQGPGAGIYRVTPSGGDPVPILEATAGNSRPQLLPDGEAVVFQTGAPGLEQTLMLVEIESGEVTDLGVEGSSWVRHERLGREVRYLLSIPPAQSSRREKENVNLLDKLIALQLVSVFPGCL